MKTFIFSLFIFLLISDISFAQYTQQGGKLVSSGISSSAFLGRSVSVSSDGSTAVIGAPFDNSNTGAVSVFIRSGGIWSQQGPKLIGSGAVGNSEQGYAVAISADGNTLVFGGPNDNSNAGAVWVFTRSGGVWTQQGTKLVGTGGIGITVEGSSVGISSDGNSIIFGGPVDNDSTGAAWIFTRSAGVWIQQGAKLVGTGNTLNSYQGFSVGISGDGNTAAIGGILDNTNTGAVWVFTRTGSAWIQQGSKLIGSGYVGISHQGHFPSFSADGSTLIFGAPFDNSHNGAAWVFTRSGGVWTQQGQKLVGTNGLLAFQGTSVSISADGNTAVIGGPMDLATTGAIWVFTRSAGVWSQQGSKLIGTGASGSSTQGYSVSISGDGSTIIEGGPNDSSSHGAAWVFYNPLIGVTPVSNEVPHDFSLSQNYPNPFNPSTKIKFYIPNVGSVSRTVRLIIYDILGREVSILINGKLEAGVHEVLWNATDFPSGVYFYKLVVGDAIGINNTNNRDFSETKKMVLIK